MLYAIIGVVVVLLLILLWINLQLMRPRSTAPDTGHVAAQVSVQENIDGSAAAPSEHAVDRPGEAYDKHEESVPTNPSADVEVLADEASRPKRLFDRPEYPFLLHDVQVPEFGSDRWKRCFQQLAQDDRILGWIAFQGENVGASDRAYESSFIEVLRTYHRTVEKLRREVGISAVQETSVVGDEGKLWFITAVDDAWVALFLDRQTDVSQLAARLLGPVLGE